MSKSRRSPRSPRGATGSGPHKTGGRSVLRELRRVHRQLESGQYAQAYPTLKRLAESAAREGRPLQAATLYAQAARARVLMAEPGTHNAAWDAAVLGQKAVDLLAGTDRVARAQALVAQLLRLLERKHYHEQAVELRAQGTAMLGAKVQPPQPPSAPLPPNCPDCSAPLRADEVEWTGARHAECAYCGANVLR